MHEMLTILTDVRGVCLSVCLSCGSSRLHCAKMAEQIKMLFGVNDIVLDVGPTSPRREEGGQHIDFGTPSYLWDG